MLLSIMKASLSLDWLQLHVDCSLCTFDSAYSWKLEPYQTKQFRKIYKLMWQGEELGTAVCEPTSVIIHGSCMIVKFSNRQLYSPYLHNIIAAFLSHNNLFFKGVTRCDLALDFNRFNRCLDPENFIWRFINGQIWKVGRGKFSVTGEQKRGNKFRYLRFGSKTSEINTYLYNKSVELTQVQDKPYIREKWLNAGLSKKQDVWRLEISIKGTGTRYVDFETGDLTRISWEDLANPDRLKQIFEAYISVHFKFVINDGQRNKSRMAVVDLIDFGDIVLKPCYLPTSTGSNRSDKVFLKKLHLLDQELRGLSEFGAENQKDLLIDFLYATDMFDYYEKNKDFWHVDTKRPY